MGCNEGDQEDLLKLVQVHLWAWNDFSVGLPGCIGLVVWDKRPKADKAYGILLLTSVGEVEVVSPKEKVQRS